MKKYIGRTAGNWESSSVMVLLGGIDSSVHPLEHHVRHSPDGFSWGYGGSGPSELAKDILWDYFGRDPHPALYHQFKDEFVAQWPQNQSWELPEASITAWIMTLPSQDRKYVPHPFVEPDEDLDLTDEERQFCAHCGTDESTECHDESGVWV